MTPTHTVTLVALFALVAAPAGDQAKPTPFVGKPLSGTTFQCRSQDVAEAGYLRDISSEAFSVSGAASVSRQTSPTTWRVTLMGTSAEVSYFSGATQTVAAAERFTVTKTELGVVLGKYVPADEPPQTITIDFTNGSFVYSVHRLNVLMNRSTVFYGACQPSVF